MKFHERLGEVRGNLQLNVSEFAELLDKPISTISRWLKGDSMPRKPYQELLPLKEHCDLAELIEGHQEMRIIIPRGATVQLKISHSTDL